MRRAASEFWSALAAALERQGLSGHLGQPQPLGGGCLHNAVRVDTTERSLFVKHNTPACADMFAAEAAGLATLAEPQALHVPRPLGHGVVAERAYLVTEFVELAGAGDAAAFGEALARLHAASAPQYGFGRDNYIGTTPQPNGWHGDWIAFWRDQRLGHQLRLAAHDARPRLADAGWRLAEDLGALFDGYTPAAARLHGDLWGGNYGYTRDATACLFDPAAYFGDREADLAMTELFGGFEPAFYAAYRAAWPLDAGYRTRKQLYNLYHVLNHAHLFGGPYPGQAQRMIEQLRAEVAG